MQVDSSVAKKFGAVLRSSRQDVGLSQQALALEVELDRTYISLLERGLRQPTLTTIILLAKPLQTSASELVRLTEDL